LNPDLDYYENHKNTKKRKRKSIERQNKAKINNHSNLNTSLRKTANRDSSILRSNNYSNSRRLFSLIKTNSIVKKSQVELNLIKNSAANKDVKEIIYLMDSETPILCEQKVHPWAENPRTIGALAVSYIWNMRI
jgi:hypothetical protein